MSHFTTFTQNDLDQTTAMPPGWYNVKILTSVQEQAKDGASTNYVLSGEVISDDKGDTRFAGRKLGPKAPWWGFNSKLIGYSRGLWESLGIAITPNTKVDWNALVGRTVCVQIEQAMYNGNVVNSMTSRYKKVGE